MLGLPPHVVAAAALESPASSTPSPAPAPLPSAPASSKSSAPAQQPAEPSRTGGGSSSSAKAPSHRSTAAQAAAVAAASTAAEPPLPPGIPQPLPVPPQTGSRPARSSPSPYSMPRSSRSDQLLKPVETLRQPKAELQPRMQSQEVSPAHSNGSLPGMTPAQLARHAQQLLTQKPPLPRGNAHLQPHSSCIQQAPAPDTPPPQLQRTGSGRPQGSDPLPQGRPALDRQSSGPTVGGSKQGRPVGSQAAGAAAAALAALGSTPSRRQALSTLSPTSSSISRAELNWREE